ncbi:PfkB family carbohydrate kinase [Nakamurella deserti]|uniref:PfkB family carbohydrate kinase n=1 Tax=Nakamurella deserti TaxID=2164074 RepID=UPI00197C90F1|nr:PfkB family carbohydrate kinase [Nakamurella deserti]
MTAPLVVIGDVMLDVDRTGEAARLSPEAPVPVLHSVVDTRRPGGAALAALLARAAGDRPVVLVAPVADDAAGRELRRLLDGRVEVVPLSWTGSTPVKTRIRAGDHPVARLDEGGDPGDIGELPDRVTEVLAAAAGILVADYGRGATAHPPLRAAIEARSGRVPVVWDPHPRGATPVPGVTVVTPNASEAGVPADAGVTGWRAAAEELGRRWSARAVCVTLGDRGAMVSRTGEMPFLVAAPTVVARDTCGAGDCFAATVAVALAGGALLTDAVVTAVAAAGAFVAAGGAAGFRLDGGEIAPVTPDLDSLLAAVRGRGGTVVATGGCFDLLHAGHVATLQAARALGDCLVVCLNSDDSVRRLKGPQRPLQPAVDRAQVLSALACVDAVVVFEEDTPATALRRVRPDVWAKGGDYTGMVLPEAAVLAEWGGEAVTVPYLAGRSTTALVELAARPVDQARR